jgi:C4-type Zn-finger protein
MELLVECPDCEESLMFKTMKSRKVEKEEQFFVCYAECPYCKKRFRVIMNTVIIPYELMKQSVSM